MIKFYFLLWLKWAIRLSVSSVFFASLVAFLITFYTYVSIGSPPLEEKNISALSEIFKFWFVIAWSFTLLISLFRSIKYIFNDCINGYELKLFECGSDEVIEVIGYGDLVKVWRKWFMLMIWLVAILMIITMFNFYNIYALFGFILVSGYFSFIIMVAKCKKVKVLRC
ncbi:MAG: hypothetical protein L3I99_04965 [Sulfurimonas sp.]|nr:hypothetical protein [Sulfurimonas sp.]